MKINLQSKFIQNTCTVDDFLVFSHRQVLWICSVKKHYHFEGSKMESLKNWDYELTNWVEKESKKKFKTHKKYRDFILRGKKLNLSSHNRYTW